MKQNQDKIAKHIIKEYYPQNLKIQAIKYYREATGVGLAEAKTAVEQIFEQQERKGKDTGIGVVGCTFVLIFGILMLLAALVIAIVVPKKRVAMIDDKVNQVSEDARKELLSDGCTEYVTDGNYVEKIFWYETGNSKDMGKKLYIFELEDEENLYLGVLSQSDKFNYYSDYCKGLAFYYNGEVTEDTVEAKDGTVYQVLVIDRDDVEALHGIPSRVVEAKKQKQVTNSLMLCIPFCISGGFLCLLGGLGIKNRKS